MDSAGSDRPQRRTALVGRELDRYKVEIAALSETRLTEEGLLKEFGADYIIFWSGRKKEEQCEAGVRFAIKSHLVSKLPGLSKGTNDRLMTLRLQRREKSVSVTFTNCSPSQTPRGRGDRQNQTSANRTNVRKALRLALSSPTSVVSSTISLIIDYYDYS